jgi:predicted phosphodiesterase
VVKKWRLVWVVVGIGLVAGGIIWFWPRRARLIIPWFEVKPKEFRLAVISDLHSNLVNLEKALARAKDDGIELVVLNGDVTTTGKKEELVAAKQVLERAGLPYLVISGNHDLYWGKRIKKNLFAEIFGPPRGSLVQDQWRLILIEEEQEPDQAIWECQRVECLVLIHRPPDQGESPKLITTLKNSGVKTVIAGHVHFSLEYEIEGIRIIVTGAAGEDRNPQEPRFLEYNLLTKERKIIMLE